MNNIKEVITRLWSHIVAHDEVILNEAKAYTDEQSFSGSWNDLTNKPDIYTKAEVDAAINAAIGAAIGGSY